MNRATWLTLTRLPLALATILVLLSDWPGRWLTAAVLVDLIGNTDYLDGWWARRRGEVTTLGKNLDFALDKICVTALLLALAGLGIVALWIPLVVLAREVVISAARLIRFGSEAPPPDFWGKAKTGLTLTAMVVLLLRRAFPDLGGGTGWLLDLGPWLMLAAVALTVLSGLNYLVKYAGLSQEKN
jgi:nicotinamide-nucleotide amidase